MRPDDAELERYLDALRRELGGLPPELISDLVGELRCHVRDILGAHGESSRDSLREVLDRLGPPAELAAQYRATTGAVAPPRSSFAAPAVARGGWSALSAAGVLPLLALWLLGACFFVAALHKPFAVERVGLWRLAGDELSLHLGFEAAPADGEELLSWWIVPLGLLAGVGSGWLGVRAGRSSLRRWRATLHARERTRGNVSVAADVTERRAAGGWLASRWSILLEAALVVALLVADRRGLVPLSNTPFLLALGWASLRLRGLRWRDAGFPSRGEWPRALALGGAAGLAMELFAIFVTEPAIARLTGSHPDVADLQPLVGSLPYLAVALALNWTLAAFGEEMGWRGYLLPRLADLGGRARASWAVSLLAVSVLFGCAHGESQGLAGIVQESWNGLLLGLLYLATSRRLAYPIVAHGIANTLALVLIYLGRYPGL